MRDEKHRTHRTHRMYLMMAKLNAGETIKKPCVISSSPDREIKYFRHSICMAARTIEELVNTSGLVAAMKYPGHKIQNFELIVLGLSNLEKDSSYNLDNIAQGLNEDAYAYTDTYMTKYSPGDRNCDYYFTGDGITTEYITVNTPEALAQTKKFRLLFNLRDG